MVRGGDGGATHRRHPPRWIGLRIVERRQAWAAGHTRSGKEGCIDPLGEDHFDLDAIGIEEVDLGVSGIGNRGSLEVHRMGAKVIQEGEQASAAEREVIERSGRSVFRLRSEEHTSELQSLMRISYAVFCLKKKTQDIIHKTTIPTNLNNNQ